MRFTSLLKQQIVSGDKQQQKTIQNELELLVPKEFQTIEDVNFLTENGYRIYATHYDIKGPGKKGKLIFLHSHGRSRSDWKEVAK